jgi:hypothetical protein
VRTILEEWFFGFQLVKSDIEILYDSVGSGCGRSRLFAGTRLAPCQFSLFECLCAFLSDSVRNECCGRVFNTVTDAAHVLTLLFPFLVMGAAMAASPHLTLADCFHQHIHLIHRF